MPLGRERFTDPRTGTFYDLPINHEAEEDQGKTRNISHTANTANIGVVRQMGETTPLNLRYTGTILTRAQYIAMWQWYNLSGNQTIYFTDFEGNVYEVLISAFNPVRKRVQKNMRDPTNAPLHIYTYSIEMDVIRVVSGPLAGVV